MLRSLDPEKNFDAPKSKKFVPTESEKKKFSQNELDHIDERLELDEDLQVNRELRRRQKEAVKVDIGLGKK